MTRNTSAQPRVRGWLRGVRSLVALSPFAAVLGLAAAAGLARADDRLPRACAGPDPFEVRLVPTAHANGAAGIVRLRFADSPFGVTVTADGHHHYEATLNATGLGARTAALVAWAATPELDRVQRLGRLDEAGRLDARITFNKFLVFVTEETDPDVERWRGRILLRGISPSGRMHTMAGHGPFSGESCGGMFGPQW